MNNFCSSDVVDPLMEEHEHSPPLQPVQDKTVIHQQLYSSHVQDVRTLNAPRMEDNNTLSNNYNDKSSNGLLNYSEMNMMRIKAAIEANVHKMHFHHIYNYMNNRPSLLKRGLVPVMAMDELGCRYLQAKIDEGNFLDVEIIVSEVKDRLHQLITHPFGNYLILKIFQAKDIVTMDQINSLSFMLISNDQKLLDVCIHDHGTRVMQNILENIENTFTLYEVTRAVGRIIVALMKNINGSYVVLQCLKLFPPEFKDFQIILDEVVRNCVNVARDKVGCSVIQKFLRHVVGNAITLLIVEIISKAMVLAEDSYGNYVVQYVIKMMWPRANQMIIEVLRGKFVRLSLNKHASNVVEDLLRYCEYNDAAVIVEEIMRSRDFLTVLKDPFGNYVAQRALQCTKGRLCRELCHLIISKNRKLRNHLYGKRVLAMATACT
ncbi:pumilio homolog 11-like [Cicer arietinum]|uniref:pumilio homolog 11-like n=1 Tax=Cicer arietinum TaxID=3827 RepID=UPI003CC55D58